jgi:hypothetical protein
MPSQMAFSAKAMLLSAGRRIFRRCGGPANPFFLACALNFSWRFSFRISPRAGRRGLHVGDVFLDDGLFIIHFQSLDGKPDTPFIRIDVHNTCGQCLPTL